MKKISIILVSLSIMAGLRAQSRIIDRVGSNRSKHAVERLEQAMSAVKSSNHPRIILEQTSGGPKEGFVIRGGTDTIRVTGFDDSGVLYGSLALADSIRSKGGIPTLIDVSDAPEMVLRGACIGLQKPWYLPGRTVYEYPYTPETFPWFYDKGQWIRYLEMLVENRMNALYLWNGHPFASLVRLKEYPYAVEVDDATFKKNEEIYRFLTAEAEKRGIWVIQMFYNIIVSKPFAEHHGLKTQDRERPILPLIADYTRKSIAAFVEKYPNVGLMVCLGEAMQGVGPDDTQWFTQTIIPGVRDGLKALGRTDEPPIVLRAHDTDAPAVMRAALPLYKNLYTEAKFNGEALTYERIGQCSDREHSYPCQFGALSLRISGLHPRVGDRDACGDGRQRFTFISAGFLLGLALHGGQREGWPVVADGTRLALVCRLEPVCMEVETGRPGGRCLLVGPSGGSLRFGHGGRA
jgi:hypothetical protein